MKYLLCLITMLSELDVRGQNKAKRPEPPTFWDCDQTCTYDKYPGLDIRRARFPFNKSASVIAVSFLQSLDLADGPAGDSIRHLLKDTLGYATIREIVVLSPPQQDSRSALLYNFYPANYFRQHVDCHMVKGNTACYFPRNALIFRNAAGEQIARIELCFQCGEYRLTPPNLNIGWDCDSRMEHFREFLRWLGIAGGLEQQ